MLSRTEIRELLLGNISYFCFELFFHKNSKLLMYHPGFIAVNSDIYRYIFKWIIRREMCRLKIFQIAWFEYASIHKPMCQWWRFSWSDTFYLTGLTVWCKSILSSSILDAVIYDDGITNALGCGVTAVAFTPHTFLYILSKLSSFLYITLQSEWCCCLSVHRKHETSPLGR